MTGALLVDRLGRRTLFIISNVGMLFDFALWTVTTALFNEFHNQSAAKATLPFIFIFYLFYDLAYTPMLIAYTLEILPFNIRAKGFAVMNLVVSLTLAFNQFVNPWALDAIHWKYYLVYCGWLVIELVFVVTYIVETRGRTLEETAALFDGEQPTQDLAAMGGEAATTGMARVEPARTSTDSKVLPHEDTYAEKAGVGEFLELRAVSVNGSSADELSVHGAPMDSEAGDGRRLYRIDEQASCA